MTGRLRVALAALVTAAAPATPADEPPDRRAFVAADALVGVAPVRSDLAVGGRLGAGTGSARLRVLAELRVEGRANAPEVQPRFASLLLAGAGVGWSPAARTWVDAVVSAGLHTVQVRSVHRDAWIGDGLPAWAGRLGVTYRPSTFGRRATLSPVVGLWAGAVWSRARHDPLRGVSWGGWAPVVTLSVGAELSLPR